MGSHREVSSEREGPTWSGRQASPDAAIRVHARITQEVLPCW